MASLKDTQQFTQGLEDLVGRLSSELQNGEVDFEKLVSLSDELSEKADGLAETFNSVNETLMQRLQDVKGGGSSGSRQGSSSSRSESKAGARS
jgi:capsule polysaccharide export protein KpsE/RkpR